MALARRAGTVDVKRQPHICINLNYRLQLLSDNFTLKLISQYNSPLLHNIHLLFSSTPGNSHLTKNISFLLQSYKKILPLTNNLIRTHDIPLPFSYEFEVLVHKPSIDISTGVTIKKSQTPENEFKKIFNHDLSNKLAIFTDASKTNNAEFTGLAVFIPSNNDKQKYNITLIASIFSAEALAIFIARNNFLSSTAHSKATIFSDSLTVLTAIQNYNPAKSKHTSHIILDIISLLYNCEKQNKNISLIWIPSHLNITGNEIADNLAKNAISSGINIITTLHYTDFVENTKKRQQNPK